jgi:hypothetical protein
MSLPGTDSQDRVAPGRVTEDERHCGLAHPAIQALDAVFPRPVRARADLISDETERPAVESKLPSAPLGRCFRGD